MVVVSALVRFLSTLPHRTITYYPDEYIYPTLARSFVTTGHFTIRGANAHFPAVLESIVTAPLWLGSNIELSMRLVQALHAIVISLAAVPLYLLARRLGLERWQALASAAFLLVLPGLEFARYLTADALAFTLTLTAIWVAMIVLESPTSFGQVAFLALSGLATFARLEYVVLPVAFMVAGFAISGRRAARRYPIAIGAPVLVFVLASVVGIQRLLGYYSGVTNEHVSVLRILDWMGTDSALLAFVAGVVIIPGALVGLGIMLIRPRLVRERAFAAFYIAFALGLLVEAGLYATNGSDRFQERYIFVLLPFIPIAFFHLVQTKRKAFLASFTVAAAIVLYASIEPITTYSSDRGDQDSPFLAGYKMIENHMGKVNAALVLAIAAGALALVGATVTVRRRLIWPALAVSLLFPGAISILTTASSASSERKVVQTFLPRDFRWIDHAGLSDVTLIVLKDSPRPHALENLFWNRSLKRVYMLHNPAPFDSFTTYGLHIGADGELLTGNDSSIDTPFVVEEYADRVQIDGAKLIERALTNSFWKPTGVPRFSSLTEGLYFDGWLNQETTTTVWPPKGRKNRGVYVLRIGLPASAGASTSVVFSAPHFRRAVALHPGAFKTVRIPFDVFGPWRVRVIANGFFMLGDHRFVSGFAPQPPDVIRSPRT
jgi:Dolichyl-phosphate-mannose-protein mannosyltransferase